MRKIELLAPAKNLEFGKTAINFGADAVYIGASQFGARQAAGNSIKDIEELVRYSHLYGAKTYVTLNTLLFDNEIELARNLCYEIYSAGADAIIIQDMGLLEIDLPPIPIHASTQTNNFELDRIKFIDNCGFERIILARELSLSQIAEIKNATQSELEVFVHGALCVGLSGQCYLSYAINGRSGNRGECSQPCRSSYNLMNTSGEIIAKDLHLLSIKDFSAGNYVKNLIDIGISSLKIEGRLKDENYIKNVTAYYRQLIDNILENDEQIKKSSSGKTYFDFIPDISRSFNRGFTDYFLSSKRQKIASLHTQKSIGKKIGRLVKKDKKWLTLKTNYEMMPGDGLCYFDKKKKLTGFLVNKVQNNKILINKNIDIKIGADIFRNNDVSFEKELSKKDAGQRIIGVEFILTDSENSFNLKVQDEDKVSATAHIVCEKNIAENKDKNLLKIKEQLEKIKNTPFRVQNIQFQMQENYFIKVSDINKLRRDCIENLVENRIKYFSAKKIKNSQKVLAEYPYKRTDFSLNITNKRAADFYKKRAVTNIEYGIEKEKDVKDKILMRTKYCIKYELEQCPLFHKNRRKEFDKELILENNKQKFKLEFDCHNCEMLIKLK